MRVSFVSVFGVSLSLVSTITAQSLPRLTPRQLAVNQLVNASRILAFYGTADDGPGHISVRDPVSPNETFLLTAGSGAPAQVTPADIAVVRINDSVVVGAALSGFATPVRPSEVFIHSSIYQRFPNTTVNSIGYYSAEQFLPWTLYPESTTNVSVVDAGPDFSAFLPAFQGAAFMGPYGAPVFSVFDTDPNTTSVSIDNNIKGHALARTMGPEGANISTVTEEFGYRPFVLMRNDGATLSGLSVPEVVFRFMAASKNARIYAHMIGTISTANANGVTPYFVPSWATRMTDNYLRSWLFWINQIESDMLHDQSRHPQLWNAAVVTEFASSALARPIAQPHMLVAFAVTLTLLLLGLSF